MWKGKGSSSKHQFSGAFTRWLVLGEGSSNPPKKTPTTSLVHWPLRDASVVRFCKWFLWRDMFCSLKIFIGRKDQKLHPIFPRRSPFFFSLQTNWKITWSPKSQIQISEPKSFDLACDDTIQKKITNKKKRQIQVFCAAQMVGWGSSSLIPATMGKSPYAVGVYIFRSLEVGENGSSFQTWIMKVAPNP